MSEMVVYVMRCNIRPHKAEAYEAWDESDVTLKVNIQASIGQVNLDVRE